MSCERVTKQLWVSLLLFFSVQQTVAGEVNPSDAYQMMAQIISDLHDIRQVKHINTPIEAVIITENKSPSDVYELAYELLIKLNRLSQQPGYYIDSDSSLPKKIAGRRVPADVFQLAELIHQKTVAIKKSLGITKPSVKPMHTLSKMPVDVYRLVAKAHAYVDTLL